METDAKEYYKLILVDDEDEVRGRISSKISEESGFRVVGTAGNGHDALELIDEHSPHVVITDIRMPFIDGIELASVIKREYPTIRVAFITGYDEIDYAKEAIALGVKSYLTKPLTQGDISRFLTQLKGELDDEFRRKSDEELLRARYEEGLPLLIDSHFAAVLSATSQQSAEGVDALRAMDIDFDGKPAVLALVHVEEDQPHEGGFAREGQKLAIRASMRSIFRRRDMDYAHFYYHDRFAFVVFGEGTLFRRELDEALMESVQTARMYLSSDIDIGVSPPFQGFKELREAYVAARKALADSRFLNTGRIVYLEQLQGESAQPVVMAESDAKRLEYTLRFGSDAELHEALMVEQGKNVTTGDSLRDYRLYTVGFLNMLVNFSAAMGVNLTEANGGDVLETVNALSGPEAIFSWFESLALRLRELGRRETAANTNALLNNAVAFMSLHFADPDLNMERTCDHVGISVSYLSLLFKRAGTTFVKRLTEIRLHKAQEILKYTTDRIIDVAEQCGYRDVYYFSHSFKKYKGMSPKKYREEQSTD